MSTGRASVAVLVRELGGAGSVPAIALRQAGLLSADFEVRVVSDSVSDVASEVPILSVRPPGLAWLHRFAHAPRELVSAERIVRRTLKLARDGRLDAVLFHTHTLAAMGGGRLRRLGVATVLVAHGDVRLRPPGMHPPMLAALYRWSNPRAYRAVDRVIALSKQFAALAEADAGAGKVRILPCPVAGPWPAVPVVRPPRFPGSPVHVGFVGRFAREKGRAALIEAAAVLLARGLKVRVTLAGDGPERGKLEGLAAARALGERLRFVGWLPESGVARLLSELDLFCMPSISENQAVAAQEALLRGVPVVGSRVGGLADYVRPGVDGELAAPDDLDSLVEALERAVHRLERGDYRIPDPRWMEQFSPESHRRELGGVLNELIGSSGRG